jgi:hypothetical protein
LEELHHQSEDNTLPDVPRYKIASRVSRSEWKVLNSRPSSFFIWLAR